MTEPTHAHPTSFPKDRIEVVLLEGVHDRGAAVLKAETFTVRRVAGALCGDQLREAIAGAHIVGIRSKTVLDVAALAAAPRLLAVGCFCIGTDQVDLAAARRRGVAVFNAPFGNTRSVAELVIAQVIMLCRRLGDRSTQMHRGVWEKSAQGAHEIRGRTLGIVGYGHIGSQVSVLAEALGMRVIFYDHGAKLPLGNARAAGSLDELLTRADAVTLHVPETAGTRGLIGRRELGLMKPGAVLINNARGSAVDEDALAAALREGRLGGAAVDVFPDEPAGSGDAFDSPLRGLGNTVLTPHIAGSTLEAQAMIGAEVAGKLVKLVNNGSTAGAVNLPEVDLPAQSRGAGERRHRLLHLHKNVPGVLSQLHRAISELGINVLGEYLQTDAEVGYVVLDVAPGNTDALRERLAEVPETIRARVLW